MPIDTQYKQLFPSKSVPIDPHEQKLVGLYQQIQEGLWLQRIKIPGGRLTGPQWRVLGQLAKTYTPRTPLHLTTRQDIELHNLRPEDVQAVQEALSDAGINCLGAAGDTYRNIVVCPCSGALTGTPDLMALASRIEVTLGAEEGIYALPRKFKISLSCGAQCGQPFIHDLGLVATKRDGTWGFRVVIAGSLGAGPETGIEWREWIAAEDILPLAVAAIRVFATHGDRENRRKARLRHVRQRIGDEAFIALMEEAFAESLAENTWPKIDLTEPGTACASRTLVFPNGDVTVEAALALASIAVDEQFYVHVDAGHGVVILGIDETQLIQRIEQAPVLGGLDSGGPGVVACPGKRWCKHGIAHTNPLADEIRSQLAKTGAKDLRICISGCPNGCSHPRVADIGLTGGMATIDGRKVEVFNVYTGGGMGKDRRLAELKAPRIPSEQASEFVQALVRQIIEDRTDG